jgi:hypothetical protein
MLGIGPEELLLCFCVVFWILPIVVIVYLVSNFLKGKDERIKALEARISQLEKEKTVDQRLDSLEKRFDEQQKK